MKKLILALSIGFLAFSATAQTPLSTATSQSELSAIYTMQDNKLSRTIEVPVKYDNYDLNEWGEMYTRVVVFNYLKEYFDRVYSLNPEKLLSDGYYAKPYTLTKKFECGKVTQEDTFSFTTRTGYVICTIQLGDYNKSGGYFSSGSTINPIQVYPYTDKDKKWAADAFVTNYNQCEQFVRHLFEKPISLRNEVSPYEVSMLAAKVIENNYRKDGYHIFDFGKGEEYNGEGCYALYDNQVLYLDFITGERKVMFSLPEDEQHGYYLEPVNEYIFAKMPHENAVNPEADAVKFYYPDGELQYKCAEAEIDQKAKTITVKSYKSVATKNKKTGKSTTTKKLVTSVCALDEFPYGLVELPSALKKGMKVKDAVKLPGVTASVEQAEFGSGRMLKLGERLFLTYNGEKYKTDVYIYSMGTNGCPYEWGTNNYDKWEEMMWDEKVPYIMQSGKLVPAVSDDAKIL